MLLANACADLGKIEYKKSSSCLAIRLRKKTLHKQTQSNLELHEYVSERGVTFKIKIFKNRRYSFLTF